MSASDFLKQSLEEYRDHLEKNFKHDVVKQNLINTKQLVNSIHGSSSSGGDKATLTFSFPFHGLYHDMKKRNQNAAEEEFFGRRKVSKQVNHRPWYNKNLWGTLGYFIGDLLYGYTGDAKESVTKHFPQ